MTNKAREKLSRIFNTETCAAGSVFGFLSGLTATAAFMGMHVPANILPFCSQELAELTGKKVATPAVPVITAQAGFEELGKQLKAKGGVKQS